MGASGGHFKNGRWVEEPDTTYSGSQQDTDIDIRLRTAAGQIGKGIDELFAIGSELIGSQEGRQHIGRKLDQITGEIMNTCEEIRREGMDFINRARDRIIR